METKNPIRKMSRLVALVVLGATLGVAAPAQAEDLASCVATQAAPTCSFTCPAYGVVKVTVHGPGEDGWIQGSVWCGTPPGTSGYVKGTTVACEEDDGSSDPFEEVWETLFDDGECSAEMLNNGDGTLGRCGLVAGARAVCSVSRESLLPEA